jgi:hypothetical protein
MRLFGGAIPLQVRRAMKGGGDLRGVWQAVEGPGVPPTRGYSGRATISAVAPLIFPQPFELGLVIGREKYTSVESALPG